jgi:hypothetical protein
MVKRCFALPKLLLNPQRHRIGVICGLTVTLASLASGAPPRANPAAETAYLAENDAAMTRMMQDMAVKPTGDVDRDFVAMMVPHHQGAIDMALAVLRYEHNEQVKRLAQEIIVTQQQEIAAMHLAVGDALPLSLPAPTQASPPHTTANPGPAGSTSSSYRR